MKKIYFLMFFITFNTFIQAQNVNEKHLGTWVNNTPIKNMELGKSMFFFGKNNEFIWTNINDEKVWTMATTFYADFGKFEFNKDTLILTLNRRLLYSTNARVDYNDSLITLTSKYIFSISVSNKLLIKFSSSSESEYLDKYLKNQNQLINSNQNECLTCEYFEKADYDYLKTECCKFTTWKDLINLICK